MRSSAKPFSLVAVALLALTTACASASGRAPLDEPIENATTLVIRNHNFSDMNVYTASGGGPRMLLGVAPGETTTRFALLPSVIAPGPTRIIADPIGGFGVARSDPLIVNPGDTVTFTIEQDLDLSTATVR